MENTNNENEVQVKQLDKTSTKLLSILEQTPAGVQAKDLAKTLEMKYGTVLAALKRLKKAHLANDDTLAKVEGKRGRVSRVWLPQANVETRVVAQPY